MARSQGGSAAGTITASMGMNNKTEDQHGAALALNHVSSKEEAGSHPPLRRNPAGREEIMRKPGTRRLQLICQ